MIGFGIKRIMALLTFKIKLFLSKLDRSNFLVWKHQILKILCSLDLKEFVMLPTKFFEGGKPNSKFKARKRQDQMIGSWFMNCIYQEVLRQISSFDTIKAAWIT